MKKSLATLVFLFGLSLLLGGQTFGPQPPGTTPFNATGGTSPRTEADRAADRINVLDYGVVNNGTGSQGSNINNAIAIAVAAGKTVYFPAGTYRIGGSPSTNILPVSNATLEGDGVGKTIFLCDDALGTGPGCVVTTGTARVDNFTFRKISVRGTVLTNPSGINNITLFGVSPIPQGGANFSCSNIVIEDSEFGEGRYFGAVMKSCDGVYFRNNHVYKMARDGVDVWGTSNAIITGNHFENVNDDSIACSPVAAPSGGGNVAPPMPNGCVITNNIIIESQGPRVFGGRNVIVANNIIKRPLGSGLIVQTLNTDGGGATADIAFGITIANNIIQDVILRANASPYNLDPDYILVINGSGTAKSTLIQNLGKVGTFGDLNQDPTSLVSTPGPAWLRITGNQLLRTLPANYFNISTSAQTTSGTTLTFTSTTFFPGNLSVIDGMNVTGLNIPPGTTVSSHTSTTVVISNAVSGTVPISTPITFSAGNGTYSDFGYGSQGVWSCTANATSCTFDNTGVPEANLVQQGIEIHGPWRNVTISGNTIGTTGVGVKLAGGDSPASLDYDTYNIVDNDFTDCGEAQSCIWYAGLTTVTQRVLVKNNRFNVDPRFVSQQRGTNGTWLSSNVFTHGIILGNSVAGFSIEDNIFRNASSAINGTPAQAYIARNKVVGVPSTYGTYNAANVGMGTFPQGWEIIHEDSNPNSGTYGQMLSTNTPFAAAMPAAGTWVPGTFVTNSTPTVCGPLGWQRLTVGAGNVAGTDWAVINPAPPQVTWATKPTASGNTNCVILVTDVGLGGSTWVSNGTFWKPTNAGVVLNSTDTSTTPVTGTTSETTTCGPIKIPASSLGTTGSIDYDMQWGFNASANNKTVKVYLGPNGNNTDTNILSFVDSNASDVGTRFYQRVFARSSQSNKDVIQGNFGNGGGSTSPLLSGVSVDSSVDTFVTATAQLANGADSINQAMCRISIRP